MHTLDHKTTENKFLNRLLLIAVSLFAFTVSALAESTPESIPEATPQLTPYQANYRVTFDRFSARSSMNLVYNQETGVYTYGSYTKPKGFAALFGKIREWSSFTLEDSNVKPKTFTHKSRDRQNIVYDWANDKAKSTSDGEEKELELQGSELDLLSLQMQLMLDLKTNQLAPTYTVIKDNDLKNYEVTVLGKEAVSIGKKTYQTTKIKQQRQGSSRHSIIWMASELDFVIVKMHQYKADKLRGTLSMTSYKAEKPEVEKPVVKKPAEEIEKPAE